MKKKKSSAAALHRKEEKLHHVAERAMKADEKVHEKIEKAHHKEEKHASKKKHHSGKRVRVAKGVSVARGVEEKMRSKKGSSSAGKYKTVSPKAFAGKSGGANKFSFPINTLARARNALARAHFAPNPEGIRRAVYRKYPELKFRFEKRHGKKAK